jgi:hypothetical protein
VLHLEKLNQVHYAAGYEVNAGGPFSLGEAYRSLIDLQKNGSLSPFQP